MEPPQPSPQRRSGPGGARGNRVVTPEAVALDLQTATVATRGLAALIDLVLQGVAGLLLVGALAAVDFGGASGTTLVVVVLVAILVIRVGYPVLMEARLGATVGHMAMGLRVLTLDGAPIRTRQALARVSVGMFELDGTFGLVALLVAASRHDGRRLGDLAAGTQVVSTRVGTGPAEALAVEVPPSLRAWASSLDTTGLGRPERTALRRYVGRADQLPHALRDELAADLADRLLPRLAASRPPSTSAHDVLVAIAGAASHDQSGHAPGTGRLTDLPPPPPPPGGMAPPG